MDRSGCGQMHLNTVLAPISWELIEPAEGHFNWDSVDALIKAARANELRLVVLWFGAWKSSMSTYAPSTRRSPRMAVSSFTYGSLPANVRSSG